MQTTSTHPSPITPILAAAALFMAGCVAFIYGVTDAGLALAHLADDSSSAHLAQLGLGCWIGTIICIGVGARRYLRGKNA